MNFLPRDICEKLVEKECASESDHFWALGKAPNLETGILEEEWYGPIVVNSWVGFSKLVPAFIFQDFCGISEQARKNSEILFGNNINIGVNGILQRNCEMTRHKMLDMNCDEWVEFMRRAVG